MLSRTLSTLKSGAGRFARAQPADTVKALATRTLYTVATEPFYPLPGRTPRECTHEEAVQLITSGSNVFIHSAAATPEDLVIAMTEHAKGEQLKDITTYSIHTEGKAPYTDEDCVGIFHPKVMFTGANVRKAVQAGRAEYIPIFLSEIPLMFRRGVMNVDVALIQVSPPDKHGFCSLGVSVDCTRAAVQAARYIIAQVNPNMPRCHGDGMIHVSHIDRLVYSEKPIFERPVGHISETADRIGQLIAENLVEDEATLQMGIGAIPDAVLARLKNHRNLGIHTEMFSDGVMDLVNSGSVTNAVKSTHVGKIIGGFAVGSRKLYDWMDDNPFVVMCDIEYVNSSNVIQRQHRMTAINSCIEVDLTGQVVSDSIGSNVFSGVGGQVDFIRGAGLAPGGRPILALPSVTSKGESRIVSMLKPGGGVVTTRAHVHHVVTEYGVAHLYGRTLQERAKELINIAHPDHREGLARQAKEELGLSLPH